MGWQGRIALMPPKSMPVTAGSPRSYRCHSHLGVYPSPGVAAHSDGNEATAPVTAEVWAEHSVWPQDPGFSRALAGGERPCKFSRALPTCLGAAA